jgi:hypothetical protein
MIENYGHGAIKVPQETPHPIFTAVPTIDFTKPFSVPVPPDTDQGQADDCVGHGWSSYHWQFTNARMAVRSIFSYIAESYGASISVGGERIVNQGQQTYAEVPDPTPETPQNMRDQTGLNPDQANAYDEKSSAPLPQDDINAVAWGIQNFVGVVFGVTGDNVGWQNMEVPLPPSTTDTWGHCLYCMGYHMHQNPDGTQERCIICKSSWCNEVKEHHIRERYFTSGNTFNAYTLIPKTMQFKTQNLGGELRIVLQASTPEQWAALCAVYGVDPSNITETVTLSPSTSGDNSSLQAEDSQS